MKKILFVIAMFTGLSNYAQVGIGTSNPDASAQLDVVSTNKGILIPRIKLTGSSDITSITSPKESLLVYNTATVSDVVPGFYYWNSTKWVALATGAISSNVPVAKGGTGATTAADALVNLGAQSLSNMTTVLGATTDHYPSESAVKFYVDAEQTRAINAESALERGLATKASSAQIIALTGALDTEKNRALDAETGLQTLINSKATAADIATAVDVEKNRALLAEAGLQTSVDSKATATDIATAVDVEKNRALLAEAGLQTSVDSKATAADISTAVDVEKNRAVGAETVLQNDINTRATDGALASEIIRATSAEAGLQADINLRATKVELDNETIRAKDVEAVLRTDIDSNKDALSAEIIRAKGVETLLQDDLDLKEELVNKSSVIDSQINDDKYPSVKAVKTYVDAMPSFYGTNGTLTSARTVTQNNNDLVFVTGTGKVDVDGSFKFSGGIFHKVVLVNTASYTVGNSDTVISFDAPVDCEFILPPASSAVGREIKIINKTNLSLISFPMGTFDMDSSTASIQPGSASSVISDGVVWTIFK